MTEPKFTKGPWVARDLETKTAILANDCMIAEAHSYGAFRQSEGAPDRAIRRANARLIAAAPNLYEALKKIAAFDDEQGNAYLKAHGSYGGFDEPGSVQIARNALAKAVLP